MTYDKFIDSALAYEQYSNTTESESEVEFTESESAFYQEYLTGTEQPRFRKRQEQVLEQKAPAQ